MKSTKDIQDITTTNKLSYNIKNKEHITKQTLENNLVP